MAIRSPICSILGHVDHGKSSILERIKGISIIKGEAGAITQSIKSYIVPLDTIKNICGDLLDSSKIDLTIPGILFLDSPGHAAFTNLRKRGGNLSDIAILVIDVNELLKPQTIESIEILKSYKTPFVIALNKIDLISGWQENKGNLLQQMNSQSEDVQKKINDQIYTLVGEIYEHGFNAERFDRVDDYTKQIAIIPCSAKKGVGISELLMVISGLAQKFLEDKLEIEVKGEAKGVVLEVMEDKRLGITADVIIYDGTLKSNDRIVIGGVDKVIETKIRSLFIPEGKKLKQVKEVHAASGVKLFAPNLKNVVSGMPLIVANKNLEEAKKKVMKEVEEVITETDNEGIVLKADSLGSLEALINLVKEKGVKVKRATIGNINKKDIADASSEKDPINQIILGFNVKGESDKVKIIKDDVIYKVIEDFEEWRSKKQGKLLDEELGKISKPCKIRLLTGHVFRQSNPAVIGVEVLGGTLEVGARLFKEDKVLTQVKEIQSEKKNVKLLETGKQAAVALTGVIVGRQIKEEDILYSEINEREFRKLRELKSFLNSNEVEILREICRLKRKKNKTWGL